jgi:hypothetical protein
MNRRQQGRNTLCDCGSGRKYKYCHGSINYREGVTAEPSLSTTESELKMQDAETQLRLAMQHHGDDAVVRSCINAMITTARSVTMVMERESSENPLVLSWYKSKTASFKTSQQSHLWNYFGESRTYTVHKGVISPNLLTAQITDFTENGVSQPISPNATMSFYRFANPPEGKAVESGGVFRICREYLDLLRDLVDEWLKIRANCASTTSNPNSSADAM